MDVTLIDFNVLSVSVNHFLTTGGGRSAGTVCPRRGGAMCDAVVVRSVYKSTGVYEAEGKLVRSIVVLHI